MRKTIWDFQGFNSQKKKNSFNAKILSSSFSLLIYLHPIFSHFSFHFQILHTKLGIIDFKRFWYLVLLFRNQEKAYGKCLCLLIHIRFVNKTLKNGYKQRYAVFYGEFENEQKKDKKNLTFQDGDWNPRFSIIFPTMIWIFNGSWGGRD